MSNQRVEIRVPKELVEEIDRVAAEYFESRSDFIRMAVMMRLKRQSLVDEPRENSILEALLSGK